MESIAVAPDLITAAAGILLVVGLWTPIVGAVIAILQCCIALLQPDDFWIHTALAVLGASLAMLGPGAWSIDARLFGRKRFDIGDGSQGR